MVRSTIFSDLLAIGPLVFALEFSNTFKQVWVVILDDLVAIVGHFDMWNMSETFDPLGIRQVCDFANTVLARHIRGRQSSLDGMRSDWIRCEVEPRTDSME